MRLFDKLVIAIATLMIAGTIVVGQFDLVPRGAMCWSVLLLGRECAGCGLTRSFAAIGRGDVAAANELNPLGPILFAWLIALVVIRALKLLGFRYAFEIDVAFAAAVCVTLVTRLVLFYLV